MKINNKRGITLIALIITVILVLILLGLTDIVLPNGLFNRVKTGKEKTLLLIESSQNEIESIKNSLPNISE